MPAETIRQIDKNHRISLGTSLNTLDAELPFTNIQPIRDIIKFRKLTTSETFCEQKNTTYMLTLRKI
jgi:hypothetical protein